MKKLICYILVYIFVQTIPFNASALVVGYSRVFGSGCGACGDTNILGQSTDLSADTSFSNWFTIKFTSSSASDCVCRIKYYLTAGGDADPDAIVGWAVYTDSGSGYASSTIVLSGSSSGEVISGDAQTLAIDYSVESLLDSTVYWIGICTDSAAKIEFQSSGGSDVRYIVAETDPTSPPTDWSTSTLITGGQMSVELTY